MALWISIACDALNAQMDHRYSQSTFTLTQTDGDEAKLTFNGTGIQIFGARRGNHGFYQVTIDGQTGPALTGKAPDPGEFQASLFSVDNLDQKLHTLTLRNEGTTFLDIDYVSSMSNTLALRGLILSFSTLR